MGFLDRLLGRESFAQWNANDPAFAEWWIGTGSDQEIVTPQTVLGLSAVIRSVSIISTTIAGLPFRTYEKEGENDRVEMPSDFDDPWPGIDGMTPFAWMETVLIHLLLWRHAFLWHMDRDDGRGIAYQPVNPDIFVKVYRENGKRKFDYSAEGGEIKTVGSETVTYIPGPSLDGTSGHPLLWAARAIFSAAISGDQSAKSTLKRAIRIGGLIVPADNEEDFEPEEGKAILEALRASVMGRENAGDLALINRRLKLQPWSPNNLESQFDEHRKYVLMQMEQLFGIPPHLLADTEKQTSWGTGVAEQNLSLARYTLRGWSDRIEQTLSMRLPNPKTQYCEFDYAGLLQGTPEQEIKLLIEQVEGGLLTIDEARKMRNLPPLTPAQKAEAALRRPQPSVVQDPQEVEA